MTAALLSPILMIAVVQYFSEALGQIGRPENFRQEQNRPAGVFMLRDCQKCTLKRRIGRELFGAGIKPGIDFRFDRAQFRLKTRRIAFRVVHQKSWIDAEESRQQFARCVCQMRPGAILDLREIRLAQTAADLALHRRGQFLLSHRTAQAAERTFDCAEGAEFVAKFHGSLPVIAICKTYIAICNLSSKIVHCTHFLYIYEFNWFISLLVNRSEPQASLRRKLNSFRVPQRLQIDSQLLALLV